MSKYILIEAIDTLFFRDGKPFAMGQEVWANSIFPPYPPSIYGALRTIFISNNLNDKTKEELIKESENLLIKGIYLYKNDEIYFPFPADLIHYKGNEYADYLELEEFDSGSHQLKHLLVAPKSAKANDGPKLLRGEISFHKYLNHDKFNVEDFKIFKEPKVGIARSNITHTTSTDEAEGRMYRVDMIRPIDDSSKWQILVEYEGIDLPTSGIFRFGGENKTAFFKHIDNLNLDFKVDFSDTNIIRVYLATPAILENGAVPNCFINNSKFELLTYAVGKPLYIGGFDMYNNMPKYMFKAAPSGSVYYLGAKVDVEEIIEDFRENNPFHETIEIDNTLKKQGFGKFFIGKCKKNCKL